jgi:hypothetical protein
MILPPYRERQISLKKANITQITFMSDPRDNVLCVRGSLSLGANFSHVGNKKA